jgi:hypothetical protein
MRVATNLKLKVRLTGRVTTSVIVNACVRACMCVCVCVMLCVHDPTLLDRARLALIGTDAALVFVHSLVDRFLVGHHGLARYRGVNVSVTARGGCWLPAAESALE